MLELRAPDEEPSARPPLNLALVLDRSGSMAGEKLAYAKQSASWLVSRLRASDRIALVGFDDEVTLFAPFAEVASGTASRAISMLHEGGMTNLSGGWLKGIEELRRAPETE